MLVQEQSKSITSANKMIKEHPVTQIFRLPFNSNKPSLLLLYFQCIYGVSQQSPMYTKDVFLKWPFIGNHGPPPWCANSQYNHAKE